MKFAPLLYLMIGLATLVEAEPAKTPPKPFNLPVIEIHNATPVNVPEPAASPGGTIELPPIEGAKAGKMTGSGRAYWGGAYGMPAGPGRAWPNASPPGTPGAPGGGVMSPAGIPSRF